MKYYGIKLSIALALGAFLFSCDTPKDEEETMSISERISAFESDLNKGNYSSLVNHFHPDMGGKDIYKDETALVSTILGINNSPFSFGDPVIASIGNGIHSAKGSFQNNSISTGSYNAEMKEDGDDNWKILKMLILKFPNDPSPYQIE